MLNYNKAIPTVSTFPLSLRGVWAVNPSILESLSQTRKYQWSWVMSVTNPMWVCESHFKFRLMAYSVWIRVRNSFIKSYLFHMKLSRNVCLQSRTEKSTFIYVINVKDYARKTQKLGFIYQISIRCCQKDNTRRWI